MENVLEFTEADLPRELTQPQPEVVAAKVREMFDGKTPVKITGVATEVPPGDWTGAVSVTARWRPRDLNTSQFFLGSDALGILLEGAWKVSGTPAGTCVMRDSNGQ